jgi:hypothetical protein
MMKVNQRAKTPIEAEVKVKVKKNIPWLKGFCFSSTLTLALT